MMLVELGDGSGAGAVCRSALHDTRSRALLMAGGMVLLAYDGLHGAPVDGLVRLANWLGVAPYGPWPTVGAQRHALVGAVAAAEKRLSKMPRAVRHDPTAAARER